MNLLKVTLTFKNPTKIEMQYLTNLLFRGNTINSQYISVFSYKELEPKIIYYSIDKLENIKLTQALTVKEISPELCSKIKQDTEKLVF